MATSSCAVPCSRHGTVPPSPLPARVLSHCADDLRFLDFVRQQHLVGDDGGFGVELLDELTHHLVIGDLLGAFQDKVFTPHQLAIADEEDLDAGFVIRPGNGKHVGIGLVTGDDLLFFHHAFDGLNLVAQCGGFFKVQVVCGAGHLFLQAADNRIGVPVQEGA